jgi:uncharacterized protein (TIGR00288 family)
LSPWWLRPTSEGAENEENEKQPAEKREPAPPLPASPATPAAPAPRGTTPASADAAAARSTAQADLEAAGTAGAGAPAPEISPLGALSQEHQPSPPPPPAYSEPYRSFWQPREPAPAREAAAPAAPPATSWEAPAAASWTSPAGAGFDEPAAPATPPAPEAPAAVRATAAASSAPRGHRASGTSADGGFDELDEADAPHQIASPPLASVGSAARRSSRTEPRGLHPIAAPFPAAVETSDADPDVEGDSESAGDTEESRAEVRKKRSRRGRGGRRKNGRAAAAPGTGASEPAEDDDDDAALEEAPAQFPPAPQAPAPLAPRAARAGESYIIPASELESMGREIVISVPDRQRPQHEERKIAVFCDFENIALGVRDSEISKFDIGLILERLLEKGKIIVKKAYADWERYSDYKRPFHEAAIELIDIPQKFYSGKNSADIKMVVDAMDLSYSKEHLDTFVILSGDSDFSPLVSKLKENNKYVIGIGVKNSSSNLLVDNCDEFIYYEDIWRDAQKGPKLDGLSKKNAEAFSLMVESIQALLRENKDVLWGSMIKQTMQRKKPSFNEGYYGYSTFSELLEDAERKNIVKLKKDQRSGTYIVTGFAKSGDAGPGRRQV